MLNSRQIIRISRSLDDSRTAADPHGSCEEAVAQRRIDDLLRDRNSAGSSADAPERAEFIIESLREHTPLHLRPRRFSIAPFIAVAASFLLAAVVTHYSTAKPSGPAVTPITELPAMNTEAIISSPFAAEARLLAEDTSRAADAVFAYLPRFGE